MAGRPGVVKGASAAAIGLRAIAYRSSKNGSPNTRERRWSERAEAVPQLTALAVAAHRHLVARRGGFPRID